MFKYYAALITAIVLWGSSYIATVLAYSTIGPLQLGCVRAVLAACFLALFRGIRKESERPEKNDMPYVALSGALGVTVYFALQNVGLKLTSTSQAALIIASYPAIILVMECIAHRTFPVPRQIAGVLVALAGMAYLVGGALESGGRYMAGNLLLVLTGVVWGFYSMITQKVSESCSISTLTQWQFIFGALFFVPLAFFDSHPLVIPTFTSGSAILFLALCCSLFALILYNYSLKGISVSTVTALLNLMPIVGILCSVVFLHEKLALRQIVGGAVIILGVFLGSSAESAFANE